MARPNVKASVRCFSQLGGWNSVRDSLVKCQMPTFYRSMATEASLTPSDSSAPTTSYLTTSTVIRRPAIVEPDVLATIYRFPMMEPLRYTTYPAKHLKLPLRRDILHRAVIFEADSTRQGTASTKWRNQVRGSKRKIRPQKGTGMARLGDKKSPMLRGGGVAHGPHPRDFSTDLPRKIYDLAWRTALSYRYSKGELMLIEDGAELEMAEPRWLEKVLDWSRMGHKDGRSLIVTEDIRPNLYGAMQGAGRYGRAKTRDDVDVKDLLELGRIVIEKSVLDKILADHCSDIDRAVAKATYD